ncbi:23S rRNA (cytidine1920-2'-O)/16S rRNA (cytidine1409-2'-O)-methyltransferase [Variovorax sp. OK605]|uniref:TlyA family RNA methyltransferase n=1 Tax=unclassified Variovorax TaxID=663243 RepID=UPI0008B98035|nr:MULTISPECIES: TlyA family RNA methyltransferase [unclassified Variovorax]SEK11691.1 23S rRNA (cytidine1920-2'-O)/16S rRNA (cytidine1409-2'-O)-methyltransferase [Variovorax sp. OK202]SFD75933.1 23S rRNA (cytidine1920-2'-O)/16S rRNA (cytidine1409-2'-O)-methyltransferase [Variovorax sp. OK212]SFQ00303.1 23S rRNA (cytidine1920-2'-O)/16S rRNA (cytidine1409-2'-O)-methyltransferase [Variovorax sp. OK605]
MRADQLLVERGLAASRSQAVRLIAGGMRWRDAGTSDAWRSVVKNKDEVPESAELELDDAAEARYVSRGGLKLEGALAVSGVDPAGKLCLDVGQSTGGFTDCLLQRGAAKVVGVDVGHGQLHAKLREDARVVAIEGVNARALSADDLAEEPEEGDEGEPEEGAGESSAPRFDLIVGDLSFISLTLVLPAVVEFLADDGQLLMLVKPQFELQPGQVGKGGIVRDETMYAVVEKRLHDACAALELKVLRWFDSPIAGGDGNREFFIHAVRADRANDAS